ncbi:DUF2155 domain-containing protein [Defluviimonas aestuarii]|uniref:DUF2155 domain-containing protein n=1 Tax=Albidovulum aestuarii TaxID=1130726 RepID=UPI00249B79FE|nr:DUF2155 domain-containing protein [Defluviimonas aestuarii]MDI3336046.1 DUF2155 domain-containing protein [Defluviimonas aestuarii]
MKSLLAVAAMLALSGAALAQDVESAPGALLRGLDKVAGTTTDIDLAVGETQEFGRLAVTLGDCRYPVTDPSSNAYAFVTIADAKSGAVAFDGWMIASSPALSAMDDPRYDVWVMRCNIPSAEGTETAQ